MLRQNLKKPIYELTPELIERIKKLPPPVSESGPDVTFEHYGYEMEEDNEPYEKDIRKRLAGRPRPVDSEKFSIPMPKGSGTGPVPRINRDEEDEVMKTRGSSTGPVDKIDRYSSEGIAQTKTAPLKFMEALKQKYSGRVKKIRRSR
jgi:hypothetical protein